jgi:hypothetical protein
MHITSQPFDYAIAPANYSASAAIYYVRLMRHADSQARPAPYVRVRFSLLLFRFSSFLLLLFHFLFCRPAEADAAASLITDAARRHAGFSFYFIFLRSVFFSFVFAAAFSPIDSRAAIDFLLRRFHFLSFLH